MQNKNIHKNIFKTCNSMGSITDTLNSKKREVCTNTP